MEIFIQFMRMDLYNCFEIESEIINYHFVKFTFSTR